MGGLLMITQLDLDLFLGIVAGGVIAEAVVFVSVCNQVNQCSLLMNYFFIHWTVLTCESRVSFD